MATGPIKARPQFTDVTSQFTVYSSCSDFKAMTDGKMVITHGRVKVGTTDQSSLFKIPSNLRMASEYVSGSVFYLHGADMGSSACLSNAGGEVQFRASRAVQGQYGIMFTMIWVIGF